MGGGGGGVGRAGGRRGGASEKGGFTVHPLFFMLPVVTMLEYLITKSLR